MRQIDGVCVMCPECKVAEALYATVRAEPLRNGDYENIFNARKPSRRPARSVNRKWPD